LFPGCSWAFLLEERDISYFQLDQGDGAEIKKTPYSTSQK
tara:strand:+ start:961 stop:1080 length:120 start_codon:yes stop_codon:yes gene_type:complete